MSHLFGRAPNGLHHHKARRSPLPFNHGGSSALNEKLAYEGDGVESSYTLVFIPLPWSNPRRKVRLALPIPPRVSRRILRPRALLVLLGAVALLVWVFGRRKQTAASPNKTTWQMPFTDPDTNIFSREELKSIWEWEVMSGHHPSSRKAPQSNLPHGYLNPSVPYVAANMTAGSPDLEYYLQGSGPKRHYVDLSLPADPRRDAALAYPKRPQQGSAADLDMIFDNCDFTRGHYVRDCLEVLRVGGQLDGNRRIKRGDLSPWSYVYTEEFNDSPSEAEADQRAQLVLGIKPADSDPSERQLKQKGDPNRPQLVLPPPYPPRPPPPTVEQPCDPNRPRLFHIFWAGAFTDKPYMAIMSFLYTQNLALDTPQAEWGQRNDPPVCRPQFHVWINPGAASSVPDPSAKRKMYEGLATNPWSAPFLHPRFQDVVKFRLWNTTEQLDGVPELKDHWRKLLHLKSTAADEEGNGGLSDAEAEAERALSDEELLREVIADFADGGKPKPVAQAKGPQKVSLGAKEEDYDKLSTVLSDMVRFVLLHRFGGVYLDADTLLLRDWEELWNWRGAWAYRWSKHDKYNTALIKMHKGSALTSFIFKTALENNMDFHPMHVSRYLADAGLDPLLYRIPDYVFDAAWINMEGYQHDRPPFPHFNEFKEFFVGERKATAEPQAAGYEAFFRGSFAYHWHNNWWFPFDHARNWPDLGPRFIRGEKLLREAIAAAKAPPAPEQDGPIDTAAIAAAQQASRGPGALAEPAEHVDGIDDDERDLSWSTVLKRTMEAFIRGERPNQYGEWINWD